MFVDNLLPVYPVCTLSRTPPDCLAGSWVYQFLPNEPHFMSRTSPHCLGLQRGSLRLS